MGGGGWSTDIYEEAKELRKRTGKKTFDYSDKVSSKPRSSWVAHDLLNPYGIAIRESRDSDEHPTSNAIAVLFDETGSMQRIPQVMQTKLPGLFSLLLRNGYVEDPQVLVCAFGDATCDHVPLQIGQFESDNRIDEQLRAIFLEGGGGSHITESYELAMYFMDRHTDIDCWNKRRKKGYLFTIGDEIPYSYVKKDEVLAVIGDTIQNNIPVEEVIKSLQRRYHYFHIIPASTNHGEDPDIWRHWQRLLGQNVIKLEDADMVCEVIGATIGMTAGNVSLSEALDDLIELGAGDTDTRIISKALATIPANAPLSKLSRVLTSAITTDSGKKSKRL